MVPPWAPSFTFGRCTDIGDAQPSQARLREPDKFMQ